MTEVPTGSQEEKSRLTQMAVGENIAQSSGKNAQASVSNPEGEEAPEINIAEDKEGSQVAVGNTIAQARGKGAVAKVEGGGIAQSYEPSPEASTISQVAVGRSIAQSADGGRALATVHPKTPRGEKNNPIIGFIKKLLAS